MNIKSDTLFLPEIGLPPAKLDPQIGLDVIFKNTTKPCAWARNPPFWIYAHPRFLGKGHPQPSGAAILNSGVPMALNLRSGRKNEIMRMMSISWKVSKFGGTAVRAQSRTFYAPPRDSIAIPASLMRGEIWIWGPPEHIRIPRSVGRPGLGAGGSGRSP